MCTSHFLLLLWSASAALGGCHRAGDSGSVDGAASIPLDVTISARTASATETLRVAGRQDGVPLLLEDLPLPVGAPVLQAGPDKIAIALTKGFRVVYIVNQRVVFGPRVATAADAMQAKSFTAARAEIYRATPYLRASVLEAVNAQSGPALADFLLETVDVRDDGEWAKALRALPPPEGARLRKAFRARVLDSHASVGGLSRMLLEPLDLERERADLIHRLIGIGTPTDTESAIAAALLIHLIMVEGAPRTQELHGTQGTSLVTDAALADYACTLVSEFAKEPTAAAGNVAAGIALALLASVHHACSAAGTLLLASSCDATVRCLGGGIVMPTSSTKQNEDVCTLHALENAAQAELLRSPSDIVTRPYAPVPAYALALVLQAGPAPESFVLAHQRRRFAVTQSLSPECDAASREGEPCHCDEATLRDAACRSSGSLVRVSSCALDVDEKAKRISHVTYTLGTHL